MGRCREYWVCWPGTTWNRAVYKNTASAEARAKREAKTLTKHARVVIYRVSPSGEMSVYYGYDGEAE